MTPPFPPETSSDPVTAMAALIIESELVLTGRATEGIERFEKTPHPDLGPISDLGRIFYATSLVVSGRRDEALPLVERCIGAARALDAPAALIAATAASGRDLRRSDSARAGGGRGEQREQRTSCTEGVCGERRH